MFTFTLDIEDLAKGDFVPAFNGHVLKITESRRPGTGELRAFLVEVAELTGGSHTELVPVGHRLTAILKDSVPF